MIFDISKDLTDACCQLVKAAAERALERDRNSDWWKKLQTEVGTVSPLPLHLALAERSVFRWSEGIMMCMDAFCFGMPIEVFLDFRGV